MLLLCIGTLCQQETKAQNDFGVSIGPSILIPAKFSTVRHDTASFWVTNKNSLGVQVKLGTIRKQRRQGKIGSGLDFSFNYMPFIGDSARFRHYDYSDRYITGYRRDRLFQFRFNADVEIGDFDDFLIIYVGGGIGFQFQRTILEFDTRDLEGVEFLDLELRNSPSLPLMKINRLTSGFLFKAGANYEFEKFRVFAEAGAYFNVPYGLMINTGIFYPL